MYVLNFILFISLIGVSWCGIILHNLRDSLHSKIYGHGLHGEGNLNSPVININNQQQQQVSVEAMIPTNHHQEQQYVGGYGLNQRGDYGSLSNGGHHSYGAAGMESNFKAGGINYHHGGVDSSSYGAMVGGTGGGIGGGMGGGMGGNMRGGFGGGIGSSHHMMKQESYNHRSAPKFGYHHDNNMFGNSQGFVAPNSGFDAASSASSSSSSASSSSSSSASSSSSSSGISNNGFIGPCRRC